MVLEFQILQSLENNLQKYIEKKLKPIWKLISSLKIKSVRLVFAIEYKNWITIDWRKMILTDKTGILLEQREKNQRVWQTALKEKKHLASVIKERYYKV